MAELAKKAQVAEFNAFYVDAHKKFMASDGKQSLLDIFGIVSGLTAKAVEEAEQVEEGIVEQPQEEQQADATPEKGGAPKKYVSPNYKSSFALSDDQGPTVKSSTRRLANPGGKSSIQFGDGGSTAPGSKGPASSSIRVMAGPGGNTSIRLGGGANPNSSGPPSASSVLDSKKCAKLCDAIYKQGPLKGVFTRFTGDATQKKIHKAPFIDYAAKLKVEITQKEVDAIYNKFIKSGGCL